MENLQNILNDDMIPLGALQRKFILNWSKIGTRWGINRTVAQVHALLIVAERPLNADEITDTLSVSRSNVSNSMKELLSWGLARTVRGLGDRRDHFEAVDDIWNMCLVILDERKRREIDPAVEALRSCLDGSEGGRGGDARTRERLEEMLAFFDMMNTWYAEVRKLPKKSALRLIKLGTKVGKFLGGVI
jgi:DNA-binding transcriptional regulator GbsR (MarR family)